MDSEWSDLNADFYIKWKFATGSGQSPLSSGDWFKANKLVLKKVSYSAGYSPKYERNPGHMKPKNKSPPTCQANL